MRISDWSSDVCSSDLFFLHHAYRLPGHQRTAFDISVDHGSAKCACSKMFDLNLGLAHFDLACVKQGSDLPLLGCTGLGPGLFERTYRHDGQARIRSVEHTPELLSLMRI